MKKTILLSFMAAFAISQLLSAANPIIPLVINPIANAPTIDGAEDAAWSDLPWNNIDVIFAGEAEGFSGPSDLTGKFKITFDSQKIYFFFRVIDDLVTQAQEHYVGDKIEIYFGLPGYEPSSQANAIHARQFAIRAQDDPTPIAQNGSANYGPASDNINTDGVDYVFIETAEGYDMEVSIDRVIALEAIPNNIEFAFDICIADNDEIGLIGKRYRKSWYNDGAINELWLNMSFAGSAKLNGSTAVPSVKDETGTYVSNGFLVTKLNENVNIQVFDITGKCVLKALNVSELNISNLKSGVYLSKIVSTSGVSGIFRFMK